MAKTLNMPVLGQSVEEVRIIQWLKNVGDPIAVGENLAEIETDKVATFFESPEAGYVREILAPADSFIAVGAPVLVVTATPDEVLGTTAPPAPDMTATADAAPPHGYSPAPAPLSGSGPASSQPIVAVSPRARRVAAERGVDTAELAGRGTGANGRVQEKDVFAFLTEPKQPAEHPSRVSPLARAVARSAGVDLAGVSGTGVGGRIVAGDVRATATPTAPTTPTAMSPTAPNPAASEPAVGPRPDLTNVRVVTLSGLRKRVADNIVRSVQRAPHVTLHLSADMGAAMELRKTLLPPIEKKTGVRLSPTDIIIKAVAVALTEHPYMNAHIEGDTISIFADVHIGLAVSLGEDGLIVPLIRDAHRKGLAEIARNRDDIAKRARANTLTSADIVGGTFSVSNLGNYGIEGFNPIIAPPQVGILGVGGIADAVVARGGVPTVRPMMALSLSFDHRATDGAPAAAFLARVKEVLETPSLLLV